jgi:hypothetical protein
MKYKTIQAIISTLLVQYLFVHVIAIAKPITSHKVGFINSINGAIKLDSGQARYPGVGCGFSKPNGSYKKYTSVAILDLPDSLYMNIDDKNVELTLVSRKGSSKLGGREIEVYKSNRFEATINIRHISDKNYTLLSDGYIQVSNKNWNKKITVKRSCDTGG